jgi:hypothetical protein
MAALFCVPVCFRKGPFRDGNARRFEHVFDKLVDKLGPLLSAGVVCEARWKEHSLAGPTMSSTRDDAIQIGINQFIPEAGSGGCLGLTDFKGSLSPGLSIKQNSPAERSFPPRAQTMSPGCHLAKPFEAASQFW